MLGGCDSEVSGFATNFIYLDYSCSPIIKNGLEHVSLGLVRNLIHWERLGHFSEGKANEEEVGKMYPLTLALLSLTLSKHFCLGLLSHLQNEKISLIHC